MRCWWPLRWAWDGSGREFYPINPLSPDQEQWPTIVECDSPMWMFTDQAGIICLEEITLA